MKGEGDWTDWYSEFEKAMRLNLKMWWDMRKREEFQKAIAETLRKIDREKYELQSGRAPT